MAICSHNCKLSLDFFVAVFQNDPGNSSLVCEDFYLFRCFQVSQDVVDLVLHHVGEENALRLCAGHCAAIAGDDFEQLGSGEGKRVLASTSSQPRDGRLKQVKHSKGELHFLGSKDEVERLLVERQEHGDLEHLDVLGGVEDGEDGVGGFLLRALDFIPVRVPLAGFRRWGEGATKRGHSLEVFDAAFISFDAALWYLRPRDSFDLLFVDDDEATP